MKSGMGAARRLQLVMLLAVVGVAGGMVGFMALEDMDPLTALYMTVITLSTVGFGEVTPLHEAGRLFVIILILFGVLIAGSTVTFVSELVFEGAFRHIVARRKMEAKLRKLSDHYIIAGFGRVGQHVAREFLAAKEPFVVIEKDESLLDRFLEQRSLALQGDATEDDVLMHAGIERAHTLISTLPDEAQNVYLTLTARHMNARLNIIARADYEEGEKKLMRAGANHVVIPHVLGGIRMAKAALQPHVVDFMHMASTGDEGLLVEEVRVPEGCRFIGQSLAESNLKQTYGISIVGIKHTGKKLNINPSAQTVLQDKDVLVIVGRAEDVERFGADLRS